MAHRGFKPSAPVVGLIASPPSHKLEQEGLVNLGIILILILIIVLVLIGALPTWPHSSSWGNHPPRGFGILLTIVVVLVVMGRL
jgi:hypothetical protein